MHKCPTPSVCSGQWECHKNTINSVRLKISYCLAALTGTSSFLLSHLYVTCVWIRTSRIDNNIIVEVAKIFTILSSSWTYSWMFSRYKLSPSIAYRSRYKTWIEESTRLPPVKFNILPPPDHPGKFIASYTILERNNGDGCCYYFWCWQVDWNS